MTIEAFFAVLTWLVAMALVVGFFSVATREPTPEPEKGTSVKATEDKCHPECIGLAWRRAEVERELCADDTDGVAP
jgi:hypothetical protein